MTEDSEVIEAAKILAEALRRVSYGGDTGPTGLEMLSMAISGEGPAGGRPLVGAIESVAAQLARIADALESRP